MTDDRSNRAGVAILAAACMAAASAHATTEDVIRSVELRGAALTAGDRAAIADEVETARAAFPDAAFFEGVTVRLLDLARLAQDAERVVTRYRAEEMHRQLIQQMFPDGSTAADALDAVDPVLLEVELGRFVTERDLGWAVFLEAMRRDMPATPDALAVGDAEAEAIHREIEARLPELEKADQMALAHADAWGMGLVAAWGELDAEGREAAVSATTPGTSVPSKVVEAITGTSDILAWAGGVDIAMTEAEQATYPELVEGLERGALSGGPNGFVQQTYGALAASGAIAGLATTNQLMNQLMIQNYTFDAWMGDIGPGMGF